MSCRVRDLKLLVVGYNEERWTDERFEVDVGGPFPEETSTQFLSTLPAPVELESPRHTAIGRDATESEGRPNYVILHGDAPPAQLSTLRDILLATFPALLPNNWPYEQWSYNQSTRMFGTEILAIEISSPCLLQAVNLVFAVALGAARVDIEVVKGDIGNEEERGVSHCGPM